MVRTLGSLVLLTGLLAPRLAAQCPDGSPPPCRAAARGAPVQATSVAVLYFDNLSRDTRDTYLADVFSEELMSRLGQLDRLQVKSRTVVRRLRGTQGEPAAVGRSLGVAHLVSGTVLRQRGRLRVTVELTRTATGNSVWTRSFERPAEDIIAVQAEVAESVAANIGARLAPAERRRIEARATRNPAAYDHLLRGRFEQNRRTQASLLRAIREFESALALDSLFVPALVGLSTANTQLGYTYYRASLGIPREELIDRGLATAARAVRLDSLSGEAWTAMGMARRSIPALARAVALDPRSAEAHHIYALALRARARDSAAIAEFEKALAIEPDRPITLLNLGQTYLLQRRVPEARRWLDSAASLAPDAPFYYAEQGLAALLMGDTAAARAAAIRVASHGDANGAAELEALIDVRTGDSVSARRRLSRVDSAMAERDCYGNHDCLQLGIALAAAGMKDRAWAMLDRLVPTDWVWYWMRRPEFDILRDEPRFARIFEAGRAESRRLDALESTTFRMPRE